MLEAILYVMVVLGTSGVLRVRLGKDIKETE
jgi:hypothetical protein